MADVECVRQFFAKHHIILHNDWETETLRYLKQNVAKIDPEAVLDLPKVMFDQWLHSDLAESTIPQLKVPLNARKLTLAKPEIVQLCSVTDISESSYSQYRSQVTDLSKDDADFCDPTEIAAMERIQPRNFHSLLMLEVSDGQTTLKATVTKHIPGIGLTTLPGTKLLLIPRIVCRRRCFILTADNCQILGGSCERLLEENYPTMKLLCRRLNVDYKEALDKINKTNQCMRQTAIGKLPAPKVQPKSKPNLQALPPPKPNAPPIPAPLQSNLNPYQRPMPVPVQSNSIPCQQPMPAPIQSNSIPCQPPMPVPTYPPRRSCFRPVVPPVHSNPVPFQQPLSAPSYPPPFQNPQMAPALVTMPPPISTYGRDHDDGVFNDGYQKPCDSTLPASVASFSTDDPDESFVEPPPMPNYAFLRRHVAAVPPITSKPTQQSRDTTASGSSADEKPEPERLLSFFAKKKRKATTKPIKGKAEPASQSNASTTSDRDNDGFKKPALPLRWKSTKTLVASECVPETPANVVRKIKTSDPSLQSAGPMDKFLQRMPPEPMMVIPPTPDVSCLPKSKSTVPPFPQSRISAPPQKPVTKTESKDLSTSSVPPISEFKKPLPPVMPAPVRNVRLPDSPQKIARKDTVSKENLSNLRFRDTTFDDDGGFDVTQEIGFQNPQRRKPNAPSVSTDNQFDFESPAKPETPPLMTQNMIGSNSLMDTTFDCNMTQPDITMAMPLSPMRPEPEDPSLYVPRSILATKYNVLETPKPVLMSSIAPDEVSNAGNVSFHTPEKKRPLPPKTPLRTKLIVKDEDSPLSNDESTDSRERTPSPRSSQSRGVKRLDPGLFSPPKGRVNGALAPVKRERDRLAVAEPDSNASPRNPKRRLDFSVLHISPPSELRPSQTSPFRGFIGDNFIGSLKASAARSNPSTQMVSFTQRTLPTLQRSQPSITDRYKSHGIELLADILTQRKYWLSSEVRTIQPIRCKPSNSLTVRNDAWVFDVEVSDISAEKVRMTFDSSFIDKALGFTANYIKTVRDEKNIAEFNRCKNRGMAFTAKLSNCRNCVFDVLFSPSGPDLPIVKLVKSLSQAPKLV